MSTDARIEVLEHSYDELKRVVRDQGHKTEQHISELGKTLHKFMDTVREQPRAWPVKEMIYTAVATAGLFSSLFAGASWWLNASIAPDRQIITRLEKQGDGLPVLNYRVEQLEKQNSYRPAP